ncbi:MAG: FAD-dependent oxidoreductase [candidate division Zixibacteria bacterium]|nr:FAD-dependent oxidoreductase [candidate division Zixibacteria bacterium]
MDNSKLKVSVHSLEWYRDNVPCRSACPVDTDSGQYVQLIGEGKYADAFQVARSPNPLASICGRVCAAPCEDACRRSAIDAPVSIRALKRFITERYGSESLQPNTFRSLLKDEKSAGAQSPGHLGAFPKNPEPTGKKIAIIGSGPAGLAAAHDLALMGHTVTVFEALDEAGGMMRFGIPEYRLPRSVIAKEISNIVSLGVTIKTKSPITAEYGISQLKAEGYEAIFISVGTQAGSSLNIPGADLDGVVKAVDYLLNINKGYKVDLGNNVLIIGGGSVALDAARTAVRGFYSPQDAIDTVADAGDIHVAIDAARSAVREGSLNVHVASLESFEEMPAAQTTQGHEELDEARSEGIVFHPSKGPKRIIGEGGQVKGIELIDVASVFDESGRFNPSFREGTEEFTAFDSIVLAIGQIADTSFISPEDGIELTPRGNVKIDSDTLATSAPGIYAGGDVAFGPRILIEAEENGKRAARSINEYLSPSPVTVETNIVIEQIPIDQYRMPPFYEKENRCRPDTIKSERRTGINEVEQVFAEHEAVKQANRCLQCHIETVYDAELCVLCNRCVDICPEECLELKPFDQVEIEGLDVSGISSLSENGEVFSVMLKDHTRCIRCGLCAERCPTGAWTMQRLNFVDVIKGDIDGK